MKLFKNTTLYLYQQTEIKNKHKTNIRKTNATPTIDHVLPTFLKIEVSSLLRTRPQYLKSIDFVML